MSFTIHDIPTPCVLIDRPRAQANITRMQSLAATHGRKLRPHAKTHKLPAIAKMQVEAGATGICCAKLGEAEVFAEAGIKDIRLPYPSTRRKPPASSRSSTRWRCRSSSITRASRPNGRRP